MDFKKKLKIRLYTAIGLIVIGVVMIIAANIMQTRNDFMSSFGLMLAVCGIARIRRYMIITKNEQTIEKQRIAENDERNIQISNKAKNAAFSIYMIIAAFAIIVLQFANKQELVQVLSMTICVLVLSYRIAYCVISKKM